MIRELDDGTVYTRYTDGSEFWMLDGMFHRLDGPAVIDCDQRVREWWVNGTLHRADGPARVWETGMCEWWVNGKLHREDGPARTDGAEIQWWYQHGMCHRIDGPAIIEPTRRLWRLWDRGLADQAQHHEWIERLDALDAWRQDAFVELVTTTDLSLETAWVALCEFTPTTRD